MSAHLDIRARTPVIIEREVDGAFEVDVRFPGDRPRQRQNQILELLLISVLSPK